MIKKMNMKEYFDEFGRNIIILSSEMDLHHKDNIKVLKEFVKIAKSKNNDFPYFILDGFTLGVTDSYRLSFITFSKPNYTKDMTKTDEHKDKIKHYYDLDFVEEIKGCRVIAYNIDTKDLLFDTPDNLVVVPVVETKSQLIDIRKVESNILHSSNKKTEFSYTLNKKPTSFKLLEIIQKEEKKEIELNYYKEGISMVYKDFDTKVVYELGDIDRDAKAEEAPINYNIDYFSKIYSMYKIGDVIEFKFFANQMWCKSANVTTILMGRNIKR